MLVSRSAPSTQRTAASRQKPCDRPHRKERKRLNFLALPTEIRTTIFRELLGDKLIHVCSCREGFAQLDRVFLCVGDGPSFDEDYQQFKNGELLKAVCQDHRCSDRFVLPRLDLNILQTCRQVYNECNYILWATNIFEFSDAEIFTGFLSLRSACQKRQLRKIQLSLPDGHLGRRWHTLLGPNIIQSLQGLRELQLVVEYISDKAFLERFTEGPVDIQPDSLFGFCALAIQKAQVIISGPFGRDPFRPKNLDPATWTMEYRREVAKHMEKLLLNVGS